MNNIDFNQAFFGIIHLLFYAASATFDNIDGKPLVA